MFTQTFTIIYQIYLARNIYNSVNYGIDLDETVLQDQEIIENIRNPNAYFRYLYNITMIFFLVHMVFHMLYFISRLYYFFKKYQCK